MFQRLTGEDRKDRDEFGAQDAAGRQRQEEHGRHRNESEDRDRLQDVEERHQQAARPLALRRPGRIGQGEHQRQNKSGQHAECGARGIFGEMHRIERHGRRLELGQRGKQSPRGLAQKRNEAEHDDKSQDVPARGQLAQEGIGLEAFHRRILAGQATN